ncbi:MAG: hypothetical protein HY744_28300 [Deltaproteobacteria bacterium]|nr:hypothetical protein [Deltaproteobacteria bacterium]
MWEIARSLLGEVTGGEIALVVAVFALVLLYFRAPQIGEAIGGLFERDDDARG